MDRSTETVLDEYYKSIEQSLYQKLLYKEVSNWTVN